MAGSKSTQARDNRIYYKLTSLRLLFLAIVHLLIMVDVFVECGMWETFVQVIPSCHDGSGILVLIQSHYYWFLHPSKSKRRDV